MARPCGRASFSRLNSRLNRESTESRSAIISPTAAATGSIHGSTERALKVQKLNCGGLESHGLNSRLNRESTESDIVVTVAGGDQRSGSIHGSTERALKESGRSTRRMQNVGSIHGSTERALKRASLIARRAQVLGGSIHGSTERALKVSARNDAGVGGGGLNSRLNRESTESQALQCNAYGQSGSIHGSTERALKDHGR